MGRTVAMYDSVPDLFGTDLPWVGFVLKSKKKNELWRNLSRPTVGKSVTLLDFSPRVSCPLPCSVPLVRN